MSRCKNLIAVGVFLALVGVVAVCAAKSPFLSYGTGTASGAECYIYPSKGRVPVITGMGAYTDTAGRSIILYGPKHGKVTHPVAVAAASQAKIKFTAADTTVFDSTDIVLIVDYYGAWIQAESVKATPGADTLTLNANLDNACSTADYIYELEVQCIIPLDSVTTLNMYGDAGVFGLAAGGGAWIKVLDSIALCNLWFAGFYE